MNMDAVQRLAAIRTEIGQAAAGAGRSGNEVDLIAVTKTHGAETILPVLEAGHRVFGENRVQEAAAKWPALREQFPQIELHLIGPLQSNKAGEAVSNFDVIETIDRRKIAMAVAHEMERQGRKTKLFVQVNTGEEPQKAGIHPGEAPQFVEWCRSEAGLNISGLMCIPPLEENPGPHFAFLAKLAQTCGVKGLSMGMSGDFATAIQFGATHVRVGSAIFGARAQLAE